MTGLAESNPKKRPLDPVEVACELLFHHGYHAEALALIERVRELERERGER